MNRLNCTDLLEPYQNVTVGMNYLSELIDKYDGNLHKALTAYHHGPTGAKDKFFGQGTYQSEYSLKVLETAEKIKEGMTEMFYTDDPVKDYDRYDAEQTTKFNKYFSVSDNVVKMQKVFPVFCSTCISTQKIGEPKQYFDMTIMDEASQCNTAVSLVPIVNLISGDN